MRQPSSAARELGARGRRALAVELASSVRARSRSPISGPCGHARGQQVVAGDLEPDVAQLLDASARALLGAPASATASTGAPRAEPRDLGGGRAPRAAARRRLRATRRRPSPRSGAGNSSWSSQRAERARVASRACTPRARAGRARPSPAVSRPSARRAPGAPVAKPSGSRRGVQPARGSQRRARVGLGERRRSSSPSALAADRRAAPAALAGQRTGRAVDREPQPGARSARGASRRVGSSRKERVVQDAQRPAPRGPPARPATASQLAARRGASDGDRVDGEVAARAGPRRARRARPRAARPAAGSARRACARGRRAVAVDARSRSRSGRGRGPRPPSAAPPAAGDVALDRRRRARAAALVPSSRSRTAPPTR